MIFERIGRSLNAAYGDFRWPQTANESVALRKYAGDLRISNKTVRAELTARVDMLPRPQLILRGVVPECPFNIHRDLKDLSDAGFRFDGEAKPTKILIIEATEGADFSFSAIPQVDTIELGLGRRKGIRTICGMVLNFYRCYHLGENNRAILDIALESPNWIIRLIMPRSSIAAFAQLERQRGYAVTHGFEISRSEGSLISAKDSKDILEVLQFFLTFVRGAYTGIGLACGSSGPAETPWQRLGFSRVSPWSNSRNWFSSVQSDVLPGLFLGFLSAWNTEKNTGLRSAIDMYAEANRDEPDVKPSLILAQAAIELLSWNALVRHRTLSEKGFRDLSASDHIRLLLSACRVSADIPKYLNNLVKFANSGHFDGPGVITEVRNRLVHPSNASKRAITMPVISEAWELAMWYLELSLLNLFSYRGGYCNRLQAAAGIRPAVESVP